MLLQAPPGEVVEVLADIRGLVGDNDALQAAILPVLERYNTEQFVTTRIPGAEHSVIVSNAGQIPGTQRYTDPRAAKSFAFDHLRGVSLVAGMI